jgi:hypothetical protein
MLHILLRNFLLLALCFLCGIFSPRPICDKFGSGRVVYIGKSSSSTSVYLRDFAYVHQEFLRPEGSR